MFLGSCGLKKLCGENCLHLIASTGNRNSPKPFTAMVLCSLNKIADGKLLTVCALIIKVIFFYCRTSFQVKKIRI